MTLVQLLAARLAGAARLVFHATDLEDFRLGAGDLDDVLADGQPNEPLADLLERIDDRDYPWGISDGT